MNNRMRNNLRMKLDFNELRITLDFDNMRSS
jgi:hypothetical protein